MGDERAVLALSSTTLLCFISLCSCFSMGAFSPLLPEIGRAGALADWQLGVVAGALGFARMATAIPAGWLAGRYLGTTLCASPPPPISNPSQSRRWTLPLRDAAGRVLTAPRSPVHDRS